MSRPHRVFIPPHPDDACARKTRYATEIAARMGAQSVMTNPNLIAPDQLWVYRCPVCTGWHCTKKPNDAQSVTKRALFAPLMVG